MRKKPKTSLLFFVVTSCLLVGCKSNTPSVQPIELSEAQLKEQLLTIECSHPAKYFDGNLKYSPRFKNALSSKVKALKLDCNILNKATLATFHDVEFHVVFSSKTGTIILEKDFTIYDFFEPGKTVNYKTEMAIENQDYKDIADFQWTIVSASCNDEIEEYTVPN